MMEIENSLTPGDQNISKPAWFIASCISAMISIFLCIFIKQYFWVDSDWENGIIWQISLFGIKVIDKSWQHILLNYLFGIILGLLAGLCLGISQRIIFTKKTPFSNSLFMATIFGAVIASLISTTNQIAVEEIKSIQTPIIYGLSTLIDGFIGINPFIFAITVGLFQYFFSLKKIMQAKQLVVTGMFGVIIGMIIPPIINFILMMSSFCIGPEC